LKLPWFSRLLYDLRHSARTR